MQEELGAEGDKRLPILAFTVQIRAIPGVVEFEGGAAERACPAVEVRDERLGDIGLKNVACGDRVDRTPHHAHVLLRRDLRTDFTEGEAIINILARCLTFELFDK